MRLIRNIIAQQAGLLNNGPREVKATLLFAGDGTDDLVAPCDYETGILSGSEFSFASQTTAITGLAWKDGQVFVGASNQENIYAYTNGVLTNTYTTRAAGDSGGKGDIAWDGTHWWSLESIGTTRKLYQYSSNWIATGVVYDVSAILSGTVSALLTADFDGNLYMTMTAFSTVSNNIFVVNSGTGTHSGTISIMELDSVAISGIAYAGEGELIIVTSRETAYKFLLSGTFVSTMAVNYSNNGCRVIATNAYKTETL